jgi:hypothetical protein
MMRKGFIAMLTVLALALASTAAYCYSGTLTWDSAETQLDVTGTQWANASTSLRWEVTQVGNVWQYQYTFNVINRNISHLILETSTGIVLGTDIYGYVLTGSQTPVGPQTWEDQGASNPNMPTGGVYGIKFNTLDPGTKNWVIQFTSTRRPVWGDFYARDGGNETVINSGFTGGTSNPTDYVNRDGTASDNRLAVPDTMVPEVPGFVALLAGMPLLLRRIRFRR